MKLSWKSTLYGPNRYSAYPAVVAHFGPAPKINWQKLEEAAEELWMSSDFDIKKTIVYFDETKNMAVNIAQYATQWSKLALNHVRGYIVNSGVVSSGDRAELWVGFHDPRISKYAVEFALRALIQILSDQFDRAKFIEQLNHLWKVCRVQHPDYQARMIMQSAFSMGIPFEQTWGQARYWQLGEGVNSQVFFESSSCEDSFLGTQVSKAKLNSKAAFQSLGFETPDTQLIVDADQLEAGIKKIGYPCVIKPTDRSGGRGVSANLRTLHEAQEAYRIAKNESNAPVMLEVHLEGDDHRIIVVDGEFVACVQRLPPHVIGDGVCTIQTLIEKENKIRSQNANGNFDYWSPIIIDDSLLLNLTAKQFSLSSIPKNDEMVQLRSNSNVSTGGTCRDVTKRTHPAIKKMSELIARTLGIQMMGLDYMTADISKSPAVSKGGIVEINTTPGLDIFTAIGWTPERAGALCIRDSIGVIPKALLIVSDEDYPIWKSVLIKEAVAFDVGWAGVDFAGLGDFKLTVQSKEGWPGVRTLLSHRVVTCAVILAKVSEIHKSGFPATRFQSSAIIGGLDSEYKSVLESVSDTVKILEEVHEKEEFIRTVIQEL